MSRRVQVLALSSRVVRVAAIVTIGLVVIGFFALTIGMSLEINIALATASLVCPILLWLELRSPRFILFGEGVIELRAAAGSVVIPDGEVVSLLVAPVGRVHPWAPPRRVVLRFRSGRRTFETTFPAFREVVEELRSRNPQATILPDD